MRPKFKENRGSWAYMGKDGWFSAVWREKSIAYSAFGEWGILGLGCGIYFDVKKGKEAVGLIKKVHRLYNQEQREKRNRKRMREQWRGRDFVSVKEIKDYLFVGAVKEPSGFSVKG